MQIILLERIRGRGNIGDIVNVKPGYARNFLIPQGKAASANEKNLEKFSKIKAELEQKAAELLKAAETRAESLKKLEISVAVKATEEGKLFGSVNTREISEAIKSAGGDIDRKEIVLAKGPIREVGEHEIHVRLHTDLMLPLKITVIGQAQS